MSLGLPLIAWGSADTPASGSWANRGTPTPVTAGQTDPFGGTGAVKVGDDDAASIEGRTLDFAITGTTMWDVMIVKQGTAAQVGWFLQDVTAGIVNRVQWELTWSGLVVTKVSGSGTATAAVALGGGYYAILWSATGLTSGNTHRLALCGAGLSQVAFTGDSIFYRRNLVLLDYLDNPISGDEPRDGSKWVQSYSGVEDAWISGPDYVLSANVRWVPGTPQSTPVIVSGWDGRNEVTGVNCGVQAMLRAGRNKSTLTFVPDRSACTTYIDSYLVEPMTDLPSLEENRGPFRTFPLKIRNASTPYEGVP